MATDPSDSGSGQPKPRRGRRCPICAKPTVDRYRPFCSARCADIDLGRWFGERYRIAGEAPEEADTEPLDGDSDAGEDRGPGGGQG